MAMTPKQRAVIDAAVTFIAFLIATFVLWCGFLIVAVEPSIDLFCRVAP